MDCGGQIAKYYLFIFNILFVMCGILLVVVGSIIMSNFSDIKIVSDAVDTSGIPVFIITLGCIISVVSFFGCCGAIRENTCLTMTYSVFMLILLLLHVFMVGYAWVQRESFLNRMDKIVTKVWEQRHADGHVMDVLQESLKCCGKDSPLDYPTSREPVPNSCCGDSATSCSILSAGLKPGCSTALRDFWNAYIVIIEYSGWAIAAVEMIAFIFACCIANQFQNERRRASY